MHLAFVTSLVTDGKPTTGFEVANEAIVSGLRAIGCKVTEIGFRQPRQGNEPASDAIVLKTLGVENAGASTLQKALWMGGAIATGLPVGGSKLRVVPWVTIENALKSLGDIDGVIINSIQMPTAFPQLLDYAPYLYVAHNVEHRSSKQNALTADGWLNRYLYQRDARLLEAIETKIGKNARHIFCLSKEDRQYFDPDGNRSSILQLLFPAQQHGDVDYSLPAKTTHDIGLIGSWSWQPNFVGLKWFLDEVVPHLDQNLSISIAGNTPHSISSPHPGVEFVGRVEDARQFVEESKVLALVSRSGTGVQLKTIEVFQMGMPCCATVSSVRGINFIPPNCFVEDDATEFAKSLNLMVNSVKIGQIKQLDGKKFAGLQRDDLHSGLQLGLNELIRQ